MCGFAQSTFLIVPLNLIGLFRSNSAETEWCAATGTATASAATTKAQTVRFILSSSPAPAGHLRIYKRSVNVLRSLPRGNCAGEEVLEVVLFTGVFHEDIRRRFDPPRPDVHPVLSVRPGVVHRHRVLH